MPAKDHYHDAVAHSLIRSGWAITSEQIKLQIANRRLWVDIRADKEVENVAILVEVKGFESKPSHVEYLASAIGQYILYIAMLEHLKQTTPLYMAVPVAAYNGILSEPLGQLAVQKVAMKLLVFDAVQEEIVKWIP